jgi:hypothetical protein
MTGREGCFVSDKSIVEASVVAETEQFWEEVKGDDTSFEQRLEDALDRETNIPHDIMPDFANVEVKEELLKKNNQVDKKQNWGHKQALKQSSRIDRSKDTMEKVEERKRMTNLEIPKLKDMMCSNTFFMFYLFMN